MSLDSMKFDSEYLRGMSLTRRDGVTALLALLGCGAVGPVKGAEPTDPWPELARDIFNGRQLADGANLVTIEMPYRAEDAAIVPVTLRVSLPAGDTRSIKAITLVIDQNPAPVAATFRVGAGRRDDLDPGAGQFLHQCACGRGARRRHAPRRGDLREGFGRMLGAHREKRRSGRRECRADAISAIRQAERGPRGRSARGCRS